MISLLRESVSAVTAGSPSNFDSRNFSQAYSGASKLEPSPERLLGLVHRQDEAVGAGRTITRLRLPSKPAATASGWRREGSRLT
jgi:hypothetical protein